jgi:hypothetical protein
MTPGEMVAALLPETPRWYWQAKALCTDDPEAFYPDAANQWYIRRIQQKYCDHCPVWQECLTTGWEDPYGIRAGTTGNQREAARRSAAK